MRSPPRLLVTGFGPFPGAPENPTAWLIDALRADEWTRQFQGRLHLEILPVEYEAASNRLVELGWEIEPDIAVHFGLAQPAKGFRLERRAENRILTDRPDQSGARPSSNVIAPGAPDLPSRLPLAQIAERLEAEDLPVEWSDDAGGYLCNYVFYLACSEMLCKPMQPDMAGFVHVPLLRRQLPEGEMLPAISEEDLLRGAKAIIEICEQNWRTGAGLSRQPHRDKVQP